jgi:membrane protein insertase Oxa1/YidC/SpoIIIJ
MEVGCIIHRKNSNCIRTFIEEFNDGFYNFKARKISIKMFSFPFLIEIDATLKNLQLKFADFHSDSALKEQFNDSSLTDFYLKYISPQKYPETRKYALLMSSVFGSTYHCEQLFSLMKSIKLRSKMHLTDEHMKVCI